MVRYRMEKIGGVTSPFIVDNETAKERSETITSYHTLETTTETKCMELVELLNDYENRIELLQKENSILHYENDLLTFHKKRLMEDLKEIELNDNNKSRWKTNL